jgi:glutamine synthetase
MSTTDSSGATDQPSPGRLTVDDLAALVGSGSITTVLVVAPDLQGRFAGKRFSAAAFMHEVLHGAAMMCTYVLDRDVDHKPFDKVWGGGFDDMLMVPDLSTLRHAAWLDRSAIVICDLVYKDGSRVEHSPRQILRTQVDRLAERRLSAYAASAPTPPRSLSSSSSAPAMTTLRGPITVTFSPACSTTPTTRPI